MSFLQFLLSTGTFLTAVNLVQAIPTRTSPLLSTRDDTCATQDWFATPTVVGKVVEDNEFCEAKWAKGIFPNSIEARASSRCLRWLKIGYSDGTSSEVGTDPGTDSHHRYGTVTWDPWSDSFTTFDLYGSGWNGGAGRIVLEMTNTCGEDATCSLDAGKYWDNPPDAVSIERGSSNNGMLMGFHGYAGDCIDGLEPYFSTSAPSKVIIKNATFDPTYEALNEKPYSERMMTSVEASNTLYNNRKDADVEMSVDLYLTTEKSTKMTVSNEDGHELGAEAGLTGGWEVSGKIGTPVASGETKSKIETSAKFNSKFTYKTAYSTENSTTSKVQTRYTLKTTVGAGKKVKCTAIAIQSDVDLSYDATLEQQFNNGDSFTYGVSGKFYNSVATEAITWCEDLDDDSNSTTTATTATTEGTATVAARGLQTSWFGVLNSTTTVGTESTTTVAIDDSATTEDLSQYITESGTYCADGTRAGDVGMSDDELLAACPL